MTPCNCGCYSQYGNWSNYRVITLDDEEIFEQALEETLGADYVPLMVSTINECVERYLFIAEKYIPGPNEVASLVVIEICICPSQDPNLVYIKPFEHAPEICGNCKKCVIRCEKPKDCGCK